MMSSFIETELLPKPYGGGSFQCKASFKLDNIGTPFKDIDVIIDTGCSLSTIPVKKLRVSNGICKSMKRMDIDNSVEYVRSYGVETGGMPHFDPKTKRQKMKCAALKFRHSVADLTLNDVRIPTQSIFVNYIRRGNILIGMDILEKMVCHWDVSRKSGKLVLLCCPHDAINEEFYKAMKDHFGITRNSIS